MLKLRYRRLLAEFFDVFRKMTKKQWIKAKEAFNDWYKNLEVEAQQGIPTTELVNKIFSFCELYSGINMYPYQEQFGKRIIRSLLENDGLELTALFARQMGK